MTFEYYYNNVPGKGLCRNNLIYTSLISKDRKTFCQWYYNDKNYHGGENKVVDPSLMEEKWNREIYFLKLMNNYYPQYIPEILDIDYKDKKIYLRIDGDDLWQKAGPVEQDYKSILPDWDSQILDIIQSYKKLGIYKMSLHPSSYFVVDGRIKSINYFFCYSEDEEKVKVKDVLSHISEERLKNLFPLMQNKGIGLENDTDLLDAQILAFDSFRNNFPSDLIDKAIKIYV